MRRPALLLALLALVFFGVVALLRLRGEERDTRAVSQAAPQTAEERAAQPPLAPADELASSAAAASSDRQSASSSAATTAAPDAPAKRASEEPTGPRGIVVDPSGRPVANAAICGVLVDASGAQRGTARNLSDANGRFCLDTYRAGRWRIEASSPDFAPSITDETTFDGRSVDRELTLALRTPARIVGRSIDDSGRPDGGREVQLRGPRHLCGSSSEEVVTDGEGRFTFEGLAPGPYSLTRLQNVDESTHTDPRKHDGSKTADARGSLRFELGEGERREVVLGERPATGVVRFGAVQHVERMDATLAVLALPAAALGKDLERAATAFVTDDDRYELELDAPGDWRLALSLGGARLGIWNVTVPASERFEFDLRLGSASIAGRVVGAAAEPRAGVSVLLRSTQAIPDEVAIVRRVASDDRGAFRIADLPGGAFELEAWDPHGGNASHVRLETPIVVGEREQRDGVELRLPGLGGLRVTLRGPDVPQRGEIFGWRAESDVEHGVRFVLNGAGPTYEISGVAAGTWYLSAVQRDLAAPIAGPFTVGATRTTDVTLELAPGAFVLAQTAGLTGSEGGLELQAVDRAGVVARSASRSSQLDRDRVVEGLPAIVVGPLAPGTYTFVLLAGERELARRDVTLSTPGETRVRFDLAR